MCSAQWFVCVCVNSANEKNLHKNLNFSGVFVRGKKSDIWDERANIQLDYIIHLTQAYRMQFILLIRYIWLLRVFKWWEKKEMTWNSLMIRKWNWITFIHVLVNWDADRIRFSCCVRYVQVTHRLSVKMKMRLRAINLDNAKKTKSTQL